MKTLKETEFYTVKDWQLEIKNIDNELYSFNCTKARAQMLRQYKQRCSRSIIARRKKVLLDLDKYIVDCYWNVLESGVDKNVQISVFKNLLISYRKNEDITSNIEIKYIGEIENIFTSKSIRIGYGIE